MSLALWIVGSVLSLGGAAVNAKRSKDAMDKMRTPAPPPMRREDTGPVVQLGVIDEEVNNEVKTEVQNGQI